MSIVAMSAEYLASAQAIQLRVAELQEIIKSKQFHEQKKLEDRIIVLNAEYNYLLRTASQLSTYYVKEKPVSRIAVLCN